MDAHMTALPIDDGVSETPAIKLHIRIHDTSTVPFGDRVRFRVHRGSVERVSPTRHRLLGTLGGGRHVVGALHGDEAGALLERLLAETLDGVELVPTAEFPLCDAMCNDLGGQRRADSGNVPDCQGGSTMTYCRSCSLAVFTSTPTSATANSSCSTAALVSLASAMSCCVNSCRASIANDAPGTCRRRCCRVAS